MRWIRIAALTAGAVWSFAQDPGALSDTARAAASQDSARAGKLWREALAADPDHARLIQIMAFKAQKAGSPAEAAGLASRALKLAPDNEALHILPVQAARQSGRPDEALALAEQAAARFPESARLHCEWGFLLLGPHRHNKRT